MGNILDRIIADKRVEVAAAMRTASLAQVRARAEAAEAPRDLFAALSRPSPAGIHLIAEIKRRSPSAGLIRDDFDPVEIARAYLAGGASAISVLTDAKYFDGRLEYVAAVRAAVPLPVLRKDFIVDEYQIWEARAAGADAVLLILEVLGAAGVQHMLPVVERLGMTALVEAHQPELLSALLAALAGKLPPRVLVGINNRDLRAQVTDLRTTQRLAALLPLGTPLVAESGIHSRADIQFVRQSGATAVLVGETLMKSRDIGATMRKLLGQTG